MSDNMKNLREAEEFILDLKSHKAEKHFQSLATKYVNAAGASYLAETVEEPDEISLSRLDGKMNAAILREDARAKRGRIFAFRGAAAACFIAACFVAAYLLVDGESFMDFFRDGSDNATVAGVTEVVVDADEYGALSRGGVIVQEGDAADRQNFDAAAGAGEIYVDALPQTESVLTAPADIPAESHSTWGFYPATDDFAPDEEDYPPRLTLERAAMFVLPEGWQVIDSSFDETTVVSHFESAAGNIVSAILGEPVYDPAQSEFREVRIGQNTAYLLARDMHSILFFDFEGRQMVLSAGQDYSDLIELAEFWLG